MLPSYFDHIFLHEVTWRMEHSRYFFPSRTELLPFSYIWFKYDIFSTSSSELRSVVVSGIGFQPLYPGSIRVCGANAWNGRSRSKDAGSG